MKILITGCRGFVGGSFGLAAVKAGHSLLGLDRAAQKENDWLGNYLSADVGKADLTAIIRDFQPQVIFHGAGTSSVLDSFDDPLADLNASLMTWVNLLEGARLSDHDPLVIFPSSAAVYGDTVRLPIAETEPIRPISPYGFHKAACELLGREYAQCFGMRILICRLFSVFGPRQQKLVVWELFRQLSALVTVQLQGTGEESRDFLSIDEASQAILMLIGISRSPADVARFDIVNVASGEEVTIAVLADLIRDAVAPHREIKYAGRTAKGDPMRWQADIGRLRSLIPLWSPRPLATTLEECVAEWKKRRVQ